MSGKRLIILEVVIFLLAAVLIGRLFYWQIIKHAAFAEIAKEQTEATVFIGASRGKILSSDGSTLVANQKAYLAYAIIPELKKQTNSKNYQDLVEDLANKLVPILLEEKLAYKEKVSPNERANLYIETKKGIVNQLNQTNLVWVPLAKKISEETKNKIKALNSKGIGFENDSNRFYPEGSMAANLLGFVGKNASGNDTGYFGLEGYYDQQLRGRSGVLIQEIDAHGRPILAATPEGLGALDGSDIVTTIDKNVQYVVEKKLAEGVKRFGARGGAIIFLEPATGAILANASYPTFNPADFAGSEQDNYKNLGISQSYEPGSTFKAITASAAFDLGVVGTNMVCPCEGPIRIDKYEITTWNNKYNPGSTPAQILQKSDNIGAAFIGEKVGIDNFLKYVTDFGFGKPTGVDLQGEEGGIVKERQNWNRLELVTASFGQGLSVTALQMVNAMAAVANDGKLVKPYVVKKIINQKGEIEVTPRQIRQVITPSTAATIKSLLLYVVEADGKEKIPYGYRVAGKTGTAQIPIGGGYTGKTVASFVGFGPVEKPRFAAIVVLFEPSASIFGVTTAEPMFFEIVQELYPYWGIPVRK